MSNILDSKFSNKIFFQDKLNQIIKENKISNAYIFFGPESIGKKESALKFMSEIIIKDNSDLKALYKLRDNNYPDYLIIEPTYLYKGNLINQSDIDMENKQKAKPLIRIEQIRIIKNFLSKKSMQSNKKFVLINDAHRLNESSSNCLLKTLEEPANAVFILLTSRVNLLLDTIISRCQLIKFKPYSNKDLKQFLQKRTNQFEDYVLDNENLDCLILISNGSPGKLLNNIEMWNQIPINIKKDIKSPIKNYEKIFCLANNINSELNLSQQEFLIEFIQRSWWNQAKNKTIIEILEKIKLNLNNRVQPRLSWEVGLLKISFQIF